MARIQSLFERITGHKPGHLPAAPYPNPTPKAWKDLGSNEPYPCGPGEAKWVGRSIPRHKKHPAGLVTGCATPNWEREARRKKKSRAKKLSVEGQLVVMPPEGGGAPYLITRNVAKLRVRDVARGRVRKDDPHDILARIAESERRRGRALPQAPGVEYPHREGSTVCDQAHPLWRELDEAVMRESIGVAIDRPELTGRKYRDQVFRQVKGSEEFARARKAEEDCAKAFAVREDRRQASRAPARDRELRELRRAYLAAGGDPTAAEYLERLSVSARARQLRRAGRVEEARALERAERERKAGAGRRFRPG
jgi:hypothetical protein